MQVKLIASLKLVLSQTGLIMISKTFIMKDTDMTWIWKAINTQEKTLKKMLELNKDLSVTFLKTAKMLLLKRFRKMIKPILNLILKMI